MTTATAEAPRATNGAKAAPVETQQVSSLLDEIIAKTEKVRGRIDLTPDGVTFGNFEGVQRYARMLVQAGCVPAGKNDTIDGLIAKATMAIMLGRRLGLGPEQAVTSIYVVNAVPTIYGDAALAICRQHDLWDESGFKEWYEVDGKIIWAEPDPEAFKKDNTAALCQTLRKGASEPRVSRFSIGQAKAAGLFGRNAQLYGGYPFRMLRFRARGYNLRDNFGDALKGFGIKELFEDAEGRTENSPAPVRPATPPIGRVSLRGNGHRPAQPVEAETVDPEERWTVTDAPEDVQQTPDYETPAPAPADEANERDMWCLDMQATIGEMQLATEADSIRAQIDSNKDWIGSDRHLRLVEVLQARLKALAKGR